MTAVYQTKIETRVFEADVSKLLHMMVHSVYSDRDVFLRELISNAADACERLRYEAIANPGLLGGDTTFRITLAIDADKKTLTVEDNGIGMNRDGDGVRRRARDVRSVLAEQVHIYWRDPVDAE